MEKTGLDKYDRYLLILVISFIAFQVLKNAFLPLHVDEANWWMQTRYLQAGYFFHPPFVVYEQFVITRLFGANRESLRLGSLLFSSGTIVLIYAFSTKLFKEKRLAFLVSLLISVIPLTSYFSALAFQEAPFYFFTIASVFLLWMAITVNRNYWYLAGISTGLMLLCKLQAVLILPCVALFLLTSRANRKWFRRKEPYIAFLIAGAMFTPTLLWYFRHHLEPITFQLKNRPGFLNNGLLAYLGNVIKHIAWQGFSLTPFVFLLSVFGLIYGFYIGFVRKDDRFKYLFCMSAPIILLFLLTTGPAYWSYTGYMITLIAAINLVPFLIAQSKRRGIQRFWLGAFLGLCVSVAAIFSLVTIIFAATGYSTQTGWSQLSAKVEQVRREQHGWSPYFASPYYFISSETAYYTGNDFPGYTLLFQVYSNPVIQDKSTYSPWVNPKRLIGKDVIFVDEKMNPDGYNTPLSYWLATLKSHFQRVESPIVFVEKAGFLKKARTFYIFRCRGYKGPASPVYLKDDVKKFLKHSNNNATQSSKGSDRIARP